MVQDECRSIFEFLSQRAQVAQQARCYRLLVTLSNCRCHFSVIGASLLTRTHTCRSSSSAIIDYQRLSGYQATSYQAHLTSYHINYWQWYGMGIWHPHRTGLAVSGFRSKLQTATCAIFYFPRLCSVACEIPTPATPCLHGCYHHGPWHVAQPRASIQQKLKGVKKDRRRILKKCAPGGVVNVDLLLH